MRSGEEDMAISARRAPRVEFTLTLFILFIVFIGYKLSVATIAMGFENVFPNSATFFMP